MTNEAQFPRLDFRHYAATARRTISRWAALGVLAMGCGLAIANVWWGPGIIQTHAGGDSPFLLQRVFELAVNLRAGVFPARWMPDAAFGLGYPFFSYYASLPYYLAALLNIAGFDLLTAIKLTQTIAMMGAAAAMWLYARTLLPRAGAMLAAAAYTLAPYHLVNVYVRGDSLQEFFAFAWYPLILWAVDKVVSVPPLPAGETGQRHRAQRMLRVIVLAGSLAALVLTHNVSTLIFAPFIVLYALARLVQQARTRGLRAIAATVACLGMAAMLGAALSAWFWLPAVGEARGVQLDNQTTGYFDFSNHFRSDNLVQSSLVFDYSVNAGLDAFAIALPQAILILVGSAAWLIRGGNRVSVVIILLLGLLSAFMITPLSAPLWTVVPLLSLAQFPWRFLSLQAFFGSVLIGGIACVQTMRGKSPHPRAIGRRYWPAVLGLTCALLLLALPGLPNERLNVRAEDVTPQSLQQYEWFSGNIGTTIRAEYLPVSVQPRPVVGPDLLQQARRALAVSGRVTSSELTRAEPARQVWHIRVDSELATMTLPLLYWPAWHARLVDLPTSGQGVGSSTTSVDLSPYPGSGWVMLTLPAGVHTVELMLDGTPLQHLAETVSGLALALMIVAGAFALWRAGPRVYWLRAGAIATGLVIVVLGSAQVIRLLDPSSPPSLQTVDYGDQQFPHRSPIVFRSRDGQTYELTAAHLEPAQVLPGEAFSLTTAWKDDRAPAEVGIEQELPSGGYSASLFRFARSISYGPPALSVHTVLSDALPGPLLLRLLARDAVGSILTPTTQSGRVLDLSFLSGLAITGSHAAPGAVDSSAIRTFPNGIALRTLDWYHPTNHNICFRPTWATTRQIAAALQVSLVLRGEDGREIARADTQPQAGLAPTWSWPLGVSVPDSYCVPTTGILKPLEPYTVLVRWYRVADQQAAGEVTLVGRREYALEYVPNVPHTLITNHQYMAPAVQHGEVVTFADSLRLLGFNQVSTTDALSVTLFWTSPSTVSKDYKLFVHLAPITTPAPVRQVDRFTLDGMYPTGMWLPNEIISETVTLDLNAVPSGTYQLAVGWYDPETTVRLPATSSAGPVADGRYVLTEIQH